MTARLISIIGPPGAGKTTLAEALAGDLPARLIREDYAGNPYLADSCAGKRDAHLPAQLFFLLSRARQLAAATWSADETAVSDYGFCQDAIFARLRLSGSDLLVYERVAALVAASVRPPDALIYLDCPEPVLLERIARRGRTFEAAMDAGFLAAMRRAYRRAANQACGACRVIEIDTSATDVRDGLGRRRLIESLRAL